MLALTSKTTTLFCFLTLLATSAIVEANEVNGVQLSRRHAELSHRMIRKRAPPDEDDPFEIPVRVTPRPNPSPDEEDDTDALPTSTNSTLTSTSGSSSGTTTSSDTTTSISSGTSSSSTPPVSDFPSSGANGLPPRPTASPSETQPEEEVVAPVETTPVESAPSATRSSVTHTVNELVTETATDVPSMASAAQQDQTKSNVMTILIAIAASIGGVFIIWTVFRKWKLGSSRKFDKRMKPVEDTWEKPEHSRIDDVIASRRLSGSSQNSGRTRGNGPLPDHDFTAGPGHLSPVGGYADMSRGPSPAPHNNGYTYGSNGTRY